MHPSDTTFSDVLQGVVAYKETNSSSLTQEQLNSLTEIQHTLERLDNQFNRLMGLNTRLVAADNISHTFDPSSGTMTILPFTHLFPPNLVDFLSTTATLLHGENTSYVMGCWQIADCQPIF